jgi:hypothetical protein
MKSEHADDAIDGLDRFVRCALPSHSLTFHSFVHTMAFSSVGRTKVAAHREYFFNPRKYPTNIFAVFLLLINIIVLALSTRVNQFQEYFCAPSQPASFAAHSSPLRSPQSSPIASLSFSPS